MNKIAKIILLLIIFGLMAPNVIVSHALSFAKARVRESNSNYSNHAKLSRRQVQRNKFVGDWILKFKKTKTDCEMLDSPDAFNSSIGISDQLQGIDYIDKSPLFKGKVSVSKIVFKRSRDISGSTHIQILSINVRPNRTARVILEIETSTADFTCSLEYAGRARLLE